MAKPEELVKLIHYETTAYMVGGGLHYDAFEPARLAVRNFNLNGSGYSEEVAAAAQRFRGIVDVDRKHMIKHGYLEQAGRLTEIIGEMGRFSIGSRDPQTGNFS